MILRTAGMNMRTEVMEAMSIVGKRAPEFAADAVYKGEVIRINSLDFYNKYVLLFFYESDFSLVCPSEMFALQERLPDFTQRNVEVMGISVDPIQAHLAWLRLPKEQGGINGITFGLISDINKSISRSFYVLDEERGTALRGTFLLDREGIVQHGSVCKREIGRNIQDILRTIDAAQYTVTNDALCPMDWEIGQPTIDTTAKI